jgi:hypothetical protein
MTAQIRSPRSGARVWVGPNRRVTVEVDAHAVVVVSGPGNGHGHLHGPPGDDIPDPIRPPGNTGDISIQRGGRELAAGRVQVRLGSGSFRDATKVPSPHLPRRWRFTGTAPGSGSMEITVRAHPPQAFQGRPAEDRRTVNVSVDDQPPTLNINSPKSRERFDVDGSRTEITVRGTAEDTQSGVSSVRVGINSPNQAATAEGSEGNRWSRWRHNLALEGIRRHTIRVEARDGVGNVKERSRTILTVDTGDPELQIRSPRPGERRFNWSEDGELLVRVTGRVRDLGSGVKSVQWRIGNGGEFTAVPEPPGGWGDPGRWTEWSVEIPIPNPGEHTLHFACYDRADEIPEGNGRDVPNEATDRLTLRAEDTPPPAMITEPSSPHRVEEQEGGVTVQVRGGLEDFDTVASVAAVEWSLDGGEFQLAQPEEENDWSRWRFPVHLHEHGIFRVRVRTRHASGTTTHPKDLEIRVRRVL